MRNPQAPGGLRRSEKRALFFSIFSMATGQSFVFATLPPLGRQLGYTDVETGSILTIGAIGFVFAAPLWGMVADRIGLRRLIALGMAVAAATTAGFGLVADARLDGAIPAGLSLTLLILLRLAMALFAAGGFPSSQAYIAERTTPAERARGMAIIGAGFGTGAVAGPVIAWILSHVSLTGPFYGVALMLALASIVIALTLGRSAAQVPDPLSGGVRGVARLAPFFLVAFLGLTAVAMLQQTLGLRFQDALGLATEAAVGTAGQGLAVMAAAMVVAQIAIGRYRGPAALLVAAGGLISVAGFLAILPATTLLETVPGLIGVGFGIGLVFPGNMALISLSAGEGRQAKAAGLGAMSQGMGMVIGPLAGAILYGLAMNAPMLVAACLLAVVTGVGAWALAVLGRRSRA